MSNHDEAIAVIRELVDAMRRYEWDADGDRPREHREMMLRARRLLMGHEGITEEDIHEARITPETVL